jgi:uncharacterized membrane protein
MLKARQPMKIEESVLINRSSQDVFAYLEVRAHDTDWMEAVVESEWLDEAAPGPTSIELGRRGRMVLKMPGGRAAFVDEVTDHVPGRRIAHQTVEGPFDLRTACLCEPEGAACRATVVGVVDRLPGGVLGRLAEPFFLRIMPRGFRSDLARLKHILEAQIDGHRAGDPLAA